ncbi:DUF429 domain-containing protein [Botrimarina hoheduenensis]|uniref:DUF429 domain-containing protein n=1 Tax=Botrimarina hoheduenensis TaxID=2528000 RepID=UPI001E5248EB|nr:DUF429 domain-containing protein [Botrimarina hoheduenensis]
MLEAAFWQWEWPEPQEALDLSQLMKEVRDAKSVMLDGPQGLASIGNHLRACERESGAVGKTPDTMPAKKRPFGGYIRSSIELFSAFHKAEIKVSPDNFIGGVCEVYPGNIWRRLANRVLPRKSTEEGRRARKIILESLGVSKLPRLPTHDENDACVGAVLAAAADNKVHGVRVTGLGSGLVIEEGGTLREGQMVIPEICNGVRNKIEAALRDIPTPTAPKTSSSRQAASDQESLDRATTLRDCLIKRALEGNAQIFTYAGAYKHIFGALNARWSQAYANQVISVAESTAPAELPGLGAVRLDAFIVSKRSGLPSDGHWESANYDREDWERVLGTATIVY